MKLSVLTILATVAASTQVHAYDCGLKGLNETVCMKVEKFCPTTISSSDLNTIKEKQGYEANGVKFDVEGKPFTKTAEGDVSLFSGRWSVTKTTTPKVVCMYSDKTGDQMGKDTKAFVTLGTKITKEIDQRVAELEKEARKVAMDANAQNPAGKNPNMTASEEPAKDQPEQDKNIQQVSATEAAPQAGQHPAEAAGVKVEGASAPAAPEAGKAQDANVQKISSYDNAQAPLGGKPAEGGKPVEGVIPATAQSSTAVEAGKKTEGYASSTGTSTTGTASHTSEVATSGSTGAGSTGTASHTSEVATSGSTGAGSTGTTSHTSEVATSGSTGTSTTGTGEAGKPAEGVTPATTTEDAGKKIEGVQASQGGAVTGGSVTGSATGGSH